MNLSMNAAEHPITRKELLTAYRMQCVMISRLLREMHLEEKAHKKEIEEYRTELASMIKRYGDLPGQGEQKEDWDEMIVAWYTTEDGWLTEKPDDATEDTPVVMDTGLAEMLDKIAIPVEKKK